MPKQAWLSVLLNDARTLTFSVTKLKEWGYLELYQNKTGTTTWSIRCQKIGEVEFTVDTRSQTPFITLDYNYKERPIRYSIMLVTVPSNLKKGNVWYFLCPHTNKRCRILFNVGGMFLHREAHKGSMYETQIQSHRNRKLISLYDRYFRKEQAYEQLWSKHFKTHYAGKPTKRYLKLQSQIEESRGIFLQTLLLS